ncbi:uncharacterized protein PAC_15601 [Phialocephala subalpina]|uniref:F-box domain-containing protein n=1 Tax=Phialocephala subalpina TaxID=576137 RepID=A0A1L7XKW4_9HELO|nr:uncharacterized protein PAC_15601 [Phialocephala subalpina]
MSDSNFQDVAHRALANPELLESILLSLPLFDLLVRAPRVCRLFRDTIKKSISLQQALYFAPKHDASRPVPNPLIRHVPNGNVMFIDQRFPKSASVLPGNPLGRYTWPEDPMSDLKPFPGWQEMVHESYDREGASWKKMLVIQPPVKELSLARSKHFIITTPQNVLNRSIVSSYLSILSSYHESTINSGNRSISIRFDIEQELTPPYRSLPAEAHV